MHKIKLKIPTFLKKINKGEILFISIFSLGITLLALFHIVVGIFQTKPGFTYLFSGHYYLDYFYYIVAIAQGTFGHIIPTQYFALFDTTLYPHLWPYSLIGLIGGFFNASPILIYWIFVCFCIFSISILSYYVLKKAITATSIFQNTLGVLLIFLAGPFYTLTSKNIFMVYYFDFWVSQNTFLKRFEPIPHHILSTLLILIISLLFVDTLEKLKSISHKSLTLRVFFVSLLSFSLITTYPFVTLVFCIAIFLFGILLSLKFLYKKTLTNNYIIRILFLYTIFIAVTTLSGLLIKLYYDSTSFSSNFKSFELMSHQDVSLWFFLLSVGPQIIFWPFGLLYLRKNSTSLGAFFILYACISTFLFFTPLDSILGTHNARFLSPINYVGYGILTISGLLHLSSKFKKWRVYFFYIVTTLFIIASLPPTLSHANQMVHDRNIFSPISYIPDTVLEGFSFLKKMPDGAVLTTPSEFIGMLVPAFTNKKVFIGRHIATPDYESKAIISDSFFTGNMTTSHALEFISQQNIKYVVLTSVEQYVLFDRC